ncbi:hypothetical protein [Companilactobacillus metriopterae]|uniref:hypothetical protein n=1 Tax=Companilactobacillus metriopterae TaxID=1909267 RepID=UPI00100B2F60|nr:hypothetical protein [Companilactobacillus metriopterae]
MMTIKNEKQIIDANIFLERFLTYRDIFSEYFKTIKVIDSGEALTYENYQRLEDNYIWNVKKLMIFSSSFIHKYNLEGSDIANNLNEYFVVLIDGMQGINFEKNTVNYDKIEESKKLIEEKSIKFRESFSLILQ